MRFYDTDSGKISIDGVDIMDITRDNLRKCYGMVLQDSWLFNGTIMENLRYGNENATEEEVIPPQRRHMRTHSSAVCLTATTP